MSPREHLYIPTVSAGFVPTQQGLCAPSCWTSPLYHAPSLFANIFFKKSRDMSIFKAIKLENRQGGIPMVGGRLKPVKSTFFWTGGCADLSIYSLKNQTFHSLNPFPQSPLSHLNFLVFIHNYVLAFHSKLIIFFLCIGFYPI